MRDTKTIVYFNGQYLPKAEASLSVEDRGTLFGDGVYEVIRYCAGRPIAMEAHLARLRRSLAGIALAPPTDVDELPRISDELVERNQMPDAKVYWQITRGPAERQHGFPAHPTPSVLVMTYPDVPLDMSAPCPSKRVTMREDRRWRDCWIKSLMLLPNVLARQSAQDAGYDDAILQRDGIVTESSSANVFIVRNGALHTHPADGAILAGVTRQIIVDLAKQLGYTVHTNTFTTDDLLAADEVFLTGTTTDIAAVTDIDGQRISDGQPGAITAALHGALLRHIAEMCQVNTKSPR